MSNVMPHNEHFTDNIDFQEVVVLVLVFVTTGLLTAIELLASPKKVLERIFPEQRSQGRSFRTTDSGVVGPARHHHLLTGIRTVIFRLGTR